MFFYSLKSSWTPIFISLTIVMLLCMGCDGQNSAKQLPKTKTVTLQSTVIPLYFSGIIEPIKTYNISAPVDGVVTEMHFHYGEVINKNQLLLVLDSPQLATDYQAALSEYLKAKKEDSNSKIKFHNTEELNKLGLVSNDDYRNNKTEAESAALSFMQATRKLQAILYKTGVPLKQIEQLDMGDIAAVNDALSRPAEKLRIFAPDSGVALLPEKSNNNTNNAGESLKLGSQVKTGQSILMVGDISGIRLAIKVSEVHINNITLKQNAIITSDAVPGLMLQGHVDYIDQQAISNDSGGLPSFLVHIVVPALTEQQCKKIRVGMSAKIELVPSKQALIKVPLSAVIMKNGKPFVKVLNSKNGAIDEVAITPGQTTLDSVEVQNGLKEGDKVVVGD